MPYDIDTTNYSDPGTLPATKFIFDFDFGCGVDIDEVRLGPVPTRRFC